MEKDYQTHGNRKKVGIFSSLFPRQYDFELMLAEQSNRTLEGVCNLVNWLEGVSHDEPVVLQRIEDEVDDMRHDMEEKLINSFSTPFDRQDIYGLSRQMDYILNFSNETAREMYAFKVCPDEPILSMAKALYLGTQCLADGVRVMKSNKPNVEQSIRRARDHTREIEDIYILSMADLLHTGDAMDALRRREIYHHLRDAGRALGSTLDILHNTIVGMT
jgi:uncharacterized protein Yka (UPF0111/DUF47 family)